MLFRLTGWRASLGTVLVQCGNQRGLLSLCVVGVIGVGSGKKLRGMNSVPYTLRVPR